MVAGGDASCASWSTMLRERPSLARGRHPLRPADRGHRAGRGRQVGCWPTRSRCRRAGSSSRPRRPTRSATSTRSGATTSSSRSARPAPASPTWRWPWPSRRSLKREVARIILTRPAVEAGERLGFLPGDLLEKVHPYLRPLYDALYDMLEPEKVAHAQREGRDRDRAARLHARPHAQRRLHHPRRGAEHHLRADEDVPDPARLQLQDGDHRRHHPGGPAGEPHVGADRDPERAARTSTASASSTSTTATSSGTISSRPSCAPTIASSPPGTRRRPRSPPGARTEGRPRVPLMPVAPSQPPAPRPRLRRPRLRAVAPVRALARSAAPIGTSTSASWTTPAIRRLNARYLRRRRATDVLAFDLARARARRALLGEVIVSADTAGAPGPAAAGVPLALELDLLVVHGLLHLAGYDDHDPREARRMHERAREILAGGRPARAGAPLGTGSSRLMPATAPGGLRGPGRPPERRQVDAAQPARRREDGHRLAAPADDAHAHHRHQAPAVRPGHLRGHAGSASRARAGSGELMVKTAERALEDVDLVCLVVEATEDPDRLDREVARAPQGRRALPCTAVSTRRTWSRPSRACSRSSRPTASPIRSRRSCRSRPRRGEHCDAAARA